MHVTNGHTHAGGERTNGRVFTKDDAVAVDRLSRQSTSLGKRVREAMECIEKGLDEYGLDRLALSFNGGKDCASVPSQRPPKAPS